LLIYFGDSPHHPAEDNLIPSACLLEGWYQPILVKFLISMLCHIDSTSIVAEVDIAFIKPYELAPIISIVSLVFLHPSHTIAFMSDTRVGDLVYYSLVVSFTCQDILNSCITDFQVNQVGNLLKWQLVLFHGSSNNEMFGLICNVARVR
jgi:hypothetical protein